MRPQPFEDTERDRRGLEVNISGHGDPFDLEHPELETTLAPQDLTPYALARGASIKPRWRLRCLAVERVGEPLPTRGRCPARPASSIPDPHRRDRTT